jgi:DNA polymerase (family 10)
MENAQVADIFDEIADLIELDEGNEYRIRSYRAAARTVRDLSQRLEDLVTQEEDLSEIPNIGESTADKIHEILETGTCQRLEEMRSKVPPELTEIMRVPDLGPRKAMQLHRELGIDDLDELREACESHKVRELEGMGKKTEENILQGLETLESVGERVLLRDAADHVVSVGRHLDGVDAIRRWEVAGSFRRRKETVGDLDILVEASDRDQAADGILELEDVDEVMGRGKERVSVRLSDGLQIDFRFFEESSFGSALMYFTGSKAHNIHVRQLAVERDWKLNEYGLFKDDHRLAGSTEESVYHRLNLPWIPPELREDRGEVEAAQEEDLPELVEAGDIRGDLQSHTDVTDGTSSIGEMAEAAADRGYDYFAITDHTKRVTMAKGLDDDGALAHAENIREVDADMDDFWLLAGIEVDILKSGALDLKEETLEELDWVVASIHYDMDMEQEEMTERLLSAIRSGVVHCLGHPTVRVLGKRDPIPFDADRVFEACAEKGVFIEVNAQPDRLDLPDFYCKRALEAGVRFTISTDAHKPSDLDFMPYGVDVARRGWLRRRDVLNTRTVKQFREALGGGGS